VSSDPFSSRPCRVILLGFGSASSAVARRLTAVDTPLQLTHILDRRAAQKQRSATYAGMAWTSQIDDVLTSDGVATISDIAAIARDKAAIVPSPALTSNFIVATSEVVLQVANSVLVEVAC